MSARPRVSVLVPTHDRLRYLKTALESVYAQTFRDFEVVVVDDGSRDGTSEWVRARRFPRLKLVRLPRNRGAAKARNAGLALCRGRFLAFLDSDDVWHPDYLASQLTRARRRGTVAAVCEFRAIDARGQALARGGYGDDVANPDYVPLTGRPYLPFPSTCLLRRAALRRVKGFDESFDLGGDDSDFFLRLALAYGPKAFCYTREALVLRRRHRAQIVHKAGPPCYRSFDPFWVRKALDLGTFFLKHRRRLRWAPATPGGGAPSPGTSASAARAGAARRPARAAGR